MGAPVLTVRVCGHKRRSVEELNRSWYGRKQGRELRDVQHRVKHSAILWSGKVAVRKNYFRLLNVWGLRKRTPSPPPLSSMKSIPAISNARRMAASFGNVSGISPSTTSALRIVATPTFEARAKSSAVHRSSARAARI
jgi:hypothetical protein